MGIFAPSLDIKDVGKQENAGEHEKEKPRPPSKQWSDEETDSRITNLYFLGALLQELQFRPEGPSLSSIEPVEVLQTAVLPRLGGIKKTSTDPEEVADETICKPKNRRF